MRLIIILKVLALLAGCMTFDEVARVTSPTGEFDAVVIEDNAGALSSYGYSVWIVAAGKSARLPARAVASLYGAVRKQTADETAYGLNVRWDDSSTLSIEYLHAKQHRLTQSLIEINGRWLRVRLRDGIEDPNAPAGGMLHSANETTALPCWTSKAC